MDMQLVIVAVAAVCAALYAGRTVWRQLRRPDDEPHGCHGCPANRVGGGSASEGESTTSGNERPLRLLTLPILLAALIQGSAVRAYDVNEWLSLGGILSGAGQCQLLTRDAGASDTCRGTLPVQPELSLHPTEADELFVKLGFAAANGLGDVSPFAFAPFAADLQDDVEDVNGRWGYLLNAWYAHRCAFREDVSLRVTGGVIDSTDYLDDNAYSHDEYTQFMNEALVNGPNAFLPSYDVGGALELEIGSWSLRGVAMQIGENDAGRSFGFFGGQLGYHAETRWGEGNYRVLAVGATQDFLDPTGTRQEGRLAVGLSFDQQLGETVGAFLRLGWQSDNAAITYEAIYSGGINLVGGIWGRPQDNIGLAYGYLPGGNENVRASHVAELYYRFVAWEYLAITADVQYMRDDLRVGRGPRGFILGLRFTAEF
jgi:porin